MVRLIIEPTGGFNKREKSFVAAVETMGIKQFGKALRAYIQFADDPEQESLISFPLEKLVAEDGKGKIHKNSGLGRFADSLLKLGYQTIIDVEEQVFDTEPRITGRKLHMSLKTKKGTVGENSEETEWQEWTVTKIEGEVAGTGAGACAGVGAGAGTSTGTSASTGAKGTPATPATATTTATASSELIEEWKNHLIEMPLPLNEAGILKEIKAIVTDEKHRSQLNAVRKVALEQLIKEGFLTLTDGKYAIQS